MRYHAIRIAVLLLAVCCLFVPAAGAQVKYEDMQKLQPKSTELILTLPSGEALKGQGLGEWLEGLGPGGEAGIARGFGAGKKNDNQKFFALGSLYASLCVKAASGSTLDAASAVEGFREALFQLKAPLGFDNYLSELELMIKSQQVSPAAATRLVGAIQVFLTEFARNRGESAMRHYQAGIWATNLMLTARARNESLLQIYAAIYFRDVFAKAGMQDSILKTLDELAALAARKELRPEDFEQIETLALRLRAQLS
jgi:hypothetical protein